MSSEKINPIEILENLNCERHDDNNGIFYLSEENEVEIILYSIKGKKMKIEYNETYLSDMSDLNVIDENIAPYIFSGEVFIPDEYEVEYSAFKS